MWKYNSEKGIMLISILILSTILFMLVTSMVLIASQNYNLAGIADKKSKALKAAEAGVEYALYELNKNRSWTPGGDINITMHFSEGETAKLISSDFVNNFTGPTQVGSTPAFCAGVLSEGLYQGQKVKVRAIFVRDDVPIYPMVSDKDIWMDGSVLNGNITVKGKDNGPGRIHANKSVNLWGGYWSSDSFDFNGGFVSSGTATVQYSSNVPEKSYNGKSVPINVPDINISNIINTNKGSCHNMPANKFFIVGYFEYQYVGPGDPGNYCIPHEGPSEYSPAGVCGAPIPAYWDETSDDKVYEHPYKYGIACVSENSGTTFTEKYRELQSIGPDVSPIETGGWYQPRNTNSSRNLFTYYPDVTFVESSSTEWNDTMDSLGMTSTVQNTGGLDVTTLTLNEDAYCSGALGLYETFRFACGSLWCGDIGTASIVPTYKPKLKLNLNNHKILSDDYLALPVVENTGTIISNNSVDVFLAYDANMVIVAKDNVCLTVRDSTPNVTGETENTLNLNGLIYSKDNIYLNTLNRGMGCFNLLLNFNGSMTCMDKVTNNTTSYAGTPNWYSNYGLQVQPYYLNNLVFNHTNYGFSSIAGLRGTDFHVKKWLTAIVD